MNDYLEKIYQYLDGATRYDRYIHAKCPFHDDSRPSFFVYPYNYYCKSCPAKGQTKNLLNDLKKKHGVFFAKKETHFRSPWSKWEDKYGSLEETLKRAHRNLIANHKTAYLTKRCIEMKTILALELGWMDDWITFPVLNCTGQIIGGIARAGETNKTQSKYCNYPGMSAEIIYVPDYKMVEYSPRLYLTYGILDAVSLYQLGYASASTTTGKRVDPSAFDTIRKIITIIPDEGEEIDAVWLSARLGWRGKVLKMNYPEGCKDVNDALMKNKDYLVSILQRGDNENISR